MGLGTQPLSYQVEAPQKRRFSLPWSGVFQRREAESDSMASGLEGDYIRLSGLGLRFRVFRVWGVQVYGMYIGVPC